MSEVVTGEAVALDLRPARVPSRLIATLIDAAAQFGLFFLLSVVLGAVQVDGAALAALSILSLVLVLIVYPIVFETLWRGRTPGKAAMGLRVVRDDGGPVGFRHALVRGLMACFFERPGLLVPLLGAAIGLLTSLGSERGKRVGDVLAGTFVQRERMPSKAVGAAAMVFMPPPLAAWAQTLDLSRLPDDLALSARQFLGRAGRLDPRAREDLGGRLVGAVAAVVTPPPPPGTPGWAYLSAVLAERRGREEARLARAAAVRAGQPQHASYDGAPGYGAPQAYPPPAYGRPPLGTEQYGAPQGYGPPAYDPPPVDGPRAPAEPARVPAPPQDGSGGFVAPR